MSIPTTPNPTPNPDPHLLQRVEGGEVHQRVMDEHVDTDLGEQVFPVAVRVRIRLRVRVRVRVGFRVRVRVVGSILTCASRFFLSREGSSFELPAF